jgi:hypothetical protein
MKQSDSAEAEFTDDERAEAAVELAYLKEERLPQALEARLWGDAQAFLGAQKNGRNIASTTASTTLMIEDAPAQPSRKSTRWATYSWAMAAAALFAIGGSRLLSGNGIRASGSQALTPSATFSTIDRSSTFTLTNEILGTNDAPICLAGCDIGLIEAGQFVKLAQLPPGVKSVKVEASVASTLQMHSNKQHLVIRATGSTSDIALERR